MNMKPNPLPWTNKTPDESIGGVYDANGNQVLQVQAIQMPARIEAQNEHRRQLTKWVANAANSHDALVAALELMCAEAAAETICPHSVNSIRGALNALELARGEP